MSLVYTNKPGKRRPFFLYKTVTYKGRTAQSRKCDADDDKNYDKKKIHLHFMTWSLPARVIKLTLVVKLHNYADLKMKDKQETQYSPHDQERERSKLIV